MGLSEEEELELLELEEAEYQYQQQQKKTKQRPPSELESFIRAGAQSGSLGFADEITGGGEALLSKLKGDERDFGDIYDESRNESRDAYARAEQANPNSSMAGNIAGGIATSFVPGLNVAKGASLLGAAGKSALQSGLTGLGSSEEESLGGLAKDTALGTGLGFATGGLAQKAGQAFEGLGNSKLFNRGASSAADSIDQTAERLAARSLGAERGTIKKLGDEKVRQAGRYALDEGLITPFASADDLIAKNKEVQKRAGESMGNVYKQIDDSGASTFNPLEVATDVDKQLGGFWRSPINAGETKQFENTLESILMRAGKDGGPIPLTEAQTLKQELGKVANWKNNLSITDKERLARDAYGIVSSAIDEATDQGAEAIGSEGLTETLKQAKGLFSKSKTAEEMLTNRFAREQGNKMFGLTDNIATAGATVAGGPVVGAATATGKRLGERYGTNVAALGADKLADMVRATPQAFGKYGKVLQDASRRGATSLAATHFILEQTDPEYQTTVRNAQGQSGPNYQP